MDNELKATHVAISQIARAVLTMPVDRVERLAEESEQLLNSAIANLGVEERAELAMAAPVARAFVEFRKAIDGAIRTGIDEGIKADEAVR